MISESDFITIPHTPDMTQVGIKYACQSLPTTDNIVGTNPLNRLRQIVAEKAVELAFVRHLNTLKIPHDRLEAAPFTDPDHYDITIGGRRCEIKSFMLTQKKRIQTVRKEPHKLLQDQASVPGDQKSKGFLSDDDIYIFAFITALITPDHRTLKKAITAEQPIYMIHLLPQKWARPEQWGSLGKLALKSNMGSALQLEIGGLDEDHQFQVENLILNPQTRTVVKENYSALNYFYSSNMPNKTIGVHSSTLHETYLIEPIAWSNIWVYGMEIIFGGYITRGEFRKKATRLPKGSRGNQYSLTRIENLTLPIDELHSLDDLLAGLKIGFRTINIED